MLLNTKFKTSLVALAVLLSACDDKAAEPQTETVTPAQEVVAVEVVEAVETMPTAEAEADMGKPKFTASEVRAINAVVTAIDYDTRSVTLEKLDGEEITHIVSADVTDLENVSVGDSVEMKFLQNIHVEVMSGEGMEASEKLTAALGNSEDPSAPGLLKVMKKTVVSTVEEINVEANTFKLKDAEGVVTEFTARNPQNLLTSQVGDVVVATYTEALAVEVTKAEEAATE